MTQNAEGVAGLAQSLEGVVGIREWFPVRQALRKKGGARSADRPSETLSDPHRCIREELTVASVVGRLRLWVFLEQSPQRGRWVQAHTVGSCGIPEGFGDAGLPVNEGAIAVEGDDVEEASHQCSARKPRVV